MNISVLLTQYFSTNSPNVFAECDRLMDELIRREEDDPTVRDAAVSVDSGPGIVIVEVVADGEDERSATQAGIARIFASVSSIVELREHPLQERDRSTQILQQAC